MNNLILASSSPYRKALLERLAIPFCCINPKVDETPLPGESPIELASRLSLLKGESVAAQYPENWVIGSDQVAELENQILNKPGNPETAFHQLKRQSGKKVCFHTSVTLLNASKNRLDQTVVSTEVLFRTLSDGEIHRYLMQEQPWDCAGSFKAEGLGISLFLSLQSDDPTALIGLPLIKLSAMLRESGYKVP